MKRQFCLVFLLLISAVVLAGCSPKGELTKSASREFFAMDTVMTITACGEQCEEAVDAAKAEVERLDALLSTGDRDSEISDLNKHGGGKTTKDTADLIGRALKIYKETEGAFDISIYPAMCAWGFADGEYRVPGAKELEEILKRVDASKIKADPEKERVDFGIEGMEIDLGGIAKGYASARVMEIFRSFGIKSGMVSLGGNVQVLGKKTSGENWRVAVQNPNGKEKYLGVLAVSDKAVITSGGYERYFEQDGIRYHHILDPENGYPADGGLVSVTIVSEDGTLADALSTALFVMGKEEAFSFWKSHCEQFDAILFDEDGMLWVTEGIAEAFSSDYEYQIVSAHLSGNSS